MRVLWGPFAAVVYGFLTVLNYENSRKVTCECICKALTITSSFKLVHGHTKSCGCRRYSGKINDENLIIVEGEDNYPEDIINQKLEESNYERLSGVILHANSKIKVKCIKCGVIKSIVWSKMHLRCKACVEKTQSEIAYNKVKDIIELNDFTVFETFEEFHEKCSKRKKENPKTRNSLVPLNIKCRKNHNLKSNGFAFNAINP